MADAEKRIRLETVSFQSFFGLHGFDLSKYFNRKVISKKSNYISSLRLGTCLKNAGFGFLSKGPFLRYRFCCQVH